ncbi:MAG: hypothetical protein ABGY09_00710 [Euryarchaeota archaeon]
MSEELRRIVEGVDGVVLDTNVVVDAFLSVASANFQLPLKVIDIAEEATAVASLLLELKRALGARYVAYAHDALIEEYRRQLEKYAGKLGIHSELKEVPSYCGYLHQGVTIACGNKGTCQFLFRLRCVEYEELLPKDDGSMGSVYKLVVKSDKYRKAFRRLKDYERFREKVLKEGPENIPDKFVDVLNVLLGYRYKLLVVTKDEGVFKACMEIYRESREWTVRCAYVESVGLRTTEEGRECMVTIRVIPPVGIGREKVDSFRYSRRDGVSAAAVTAD